MFINIWNYIWIVCSSLVITISSDRKKWWNFKKFWSASNRFLSKKFAPQNFSMIFLANDSTITNHCFRYYLRAFFLNSTNGFLFNLRIKIQRNPFEGGRKWRGSSGTFYSNSMSWVFDASGNSKKKIIRKSYGFPNFEANFKNIYLLVLRLLTASYLFINTVLSQTE